MRIRGAKTELEEAGLETDGMAKSTSKLRDELLALSGVDIMLDKNTFKSTYQIMDELSQKWEDISDIDQANIIELIAGKRQGNLVAGLMKNFDIARKTLNTALNESEGSATRELENWNKGIEASLSHFKTQFQSFSTETLDSGIVKGFVDGGTAILDILTKIVSVGNGLPAVGAAIGGILSFQGVDVFSLFKKQQTGAFSEGTLDFSKQIVYSSGNGNLGKTSVDALASTFKDVDFSVVQMAKDVQEGNMTIDEFSKKTFEAKKETTGFKKVSSSVKDGLKSVGRMALNMGTAFAVTAAITGAFKAIDYVTHGFSRSIEKASTAAQEYSTLQNEVKTLNAQYESQVDKIKQLQALKNAGNITMGQEAELNGLIQQNDLLKQQLDLQKSLLEVKKSASVEAAKNASGTEMSFVEMNQKKHGKWKGYWKAFLGLFDTRVNDDTLSDYDQWKEADTTQSGLSEKYVKDLKEYEKKSAKVKKKLLKDPTNKKLLKEQEELDKNILDTKMNMQDTASTLSEWIKQSSDEFGNPLKGMSKYIDEWKDSLNLINNYGKSQKEIDFNNLETYFSSSNGKAMKKNIEEIARKGGTATDAIKELTNAGIDLASIDVTRAGFVRYFEDLKRTAKEAESAVRSVDGSFDGVNSAFESANQGASYDKMIEYFKTSKELNKKGLWGTDDFKTIAQFGVGYDIGQKLKDNADAYTYASDAYVEAYNQALPLLERWYGNEDELVNMNNVLADFTSKGLAKDLGSGEFSFKDENGAMMFKNTAQAAKLLGTSIDNVELAMSKLQEHGFEFDNVVFSGKGIKDYKESLDGIRSIYESLDDGRNKDRYKTLLSGWDDEYTKVQADLSTLTEEQIIKIKFEYDLASLLAEIEEQDSQWNYGDHSAELGAARIASKQQYRELREGNSGYNELSDEHYAQTYGIIENLQKQFTSDMDEELRASVQNQISAIMDLQNAFQDMFADGTVANWQDFLKTDSFHSTLEEIAEEANIGVEKLYELLGINIPNKEVKVDAKTEDAKSKMDDLSQYTPEGFRKDIEVAVDYIRGSQEEPELKVALLDYVKNHQEDPEFREALMNYVKSGQQDPDAKEAMLNYLKKSQEEPDSPVSGLINWGLGTVTLPKLSLTGFINWVNGDKPKPAKQNGTAHANGTVGGLYPIPKLSSRALAMGTLQDDSWLKSSWKTKDGQIALTGEVGQEIVVNGNKWWTVGDNGAEFASIPQGSIVFNHKQTEELLSKGFTNSRGRAYLGGSAFSNGGRLPSASASGSSSSSSNASKSASDADKATKDALDAITDYFDWIKVRYDRLARETQISENMIDKAIGLSSKQVKTVETIRKVQNEINAAQQGANRYLSHANWFASQSGLSNDIVSRVQNGTIDINKYDENTQKKITEYQKWYEEYLNSIDKITELQEKEVELAQKKLENIEDFYELVNSVSEAMQNANESFLDFSDAKGFSNVSDSVKQVYQESMNEAQKIYDNSVRQLHDYQEEFNSLVGSGYIKEGSDAWYEAKAKLYELSETVNEAGSSIVEFEDKIRELEYTKIQNIIDGFERAVDKLEAYVSLQESRGEVVPENIYQKQLDSNNSRIQANYDLREAKLLEQSYYDVNSKRYQELAEEINKIDTETLGLLESNEKLKDSIYELRFTPLDEALDKYKKLSDEIDKFSQLINEDAFFDKNGNGTIELSTHIAMIQQQMGLAKQQIADYRTGLQKLQESLDNGVISQKEFNEKSEEYRDGLQSSVISVKKYQDALTDLYMTQLKNEVDATEKVIDKWAEARKQQESYWSYSKKLKGQQKSVDMLKAQIEALNGVNNATALAEKKRLEAELAREQEALDDTKRDHKNEMMDLGDSKTKEQLQTMLEDTEYEIAHSAEKQESIISQMLNNVLGKYQEVFGKINSIIGNTGWVGSNGFNSTQGQLGTSSGAQSQNHAATQKPTNTKPSDVASGTVTDSIKDNSSHNQHIQSEIMKDPNTDNRRVAEVKLSKSSVTLQEGSATTITATFRPTDAKNKGLLWNSSNTAIASVSSGTIQALKPGGCKITATTVDGSNIVTSVSVTVTKKPDPPKPPQNPTIQNNTGTITGDGFAKVGDTVTLKSGQQYYHDSWGLSPAGTRYAGVKNGVIIDGYSSAKYGGSSRSTGGYDVHIRSADGKFGDLGWVSLDQLEGYAKGTDIHGIRGKQTAWTQENGKEFIIRKSDGAMLTKLNHGDVVFNNKLTRNLMEWGKISPDDSIKADVINNLPNRANNFVVEQHIGNLLTVEGNVDKNALPELKELLKQSCDYTVKHINSELRKNGFRR